MAFGRSRRAGTVGLSGDSIPLCEIRKHLSNAAASQGFWGIPG